jgi:hypothetical protein
VKHVNVEAKRAFDHQASRSMNFIGQFRPVRPSELNTWLTDWGIPYTLFATGCPSVWEIDDA